MAKPLSEGIFERLKNSYGKFGYIQYTAEIQPKFHGKENAPEGVADFDITIDEGEQFIVRSIRFVGPDDNSRVALLREFLLREGDVFNHDLLRESVSRINTNGLFEAIDVDKDIDYRVSEKTPLVDLTIHVKKKTIASAASR